MMPILSLWLALFAPSEAAHEFYVSITQLEIKNDTLQMSLRIFTDDLEYALNEHSDKKIFLEDHGMERQNFVHIRDYLNKNYEVGNGSKNLSIHWLGHEFEDDVCWIYGEVAIPKDQSIVFVRNRLLMDVYPEQQNILHFTKEGEVKSGLATRTNSEVRFLK